jgi:hypothetical protein
MIGFTRRPQPLDVDDTIELLATDPGQRAASFPFERESSKPGFIFRKLKWCTWPGEL